MYVPGKQLGDGGAPTVLEQVLHVDGVEAHSRWRGRERRVAGSAGAHPVGIALEVRSQCAFQRPMMCDVWICELRLIGVRAEVE